MANWWEADSFTINTGAVVSGVIGDTYAQDGTDHVLDEVSGTPGFDYEYWFENIPAGVTSFRFYNYGYYLGNPAHVCLVQAWNYTTLAWVLLGNMPDESSDQSYIWPTLGDTDYVSGGQAKIRFYHPVSGVGAHKLYMDMLLIENMGLDVTSLAPTTIAPTTAPPTTVAPTTMVPTTWMTTAPPTTLVPTTAAPTAAPTTPPPHNAAENLWFNCRANGYFGVIIANAEIGGVLLSYSYGGDEEGEIVCKGTISGTIPIADIHLGDDEGEMTCAVNVSGQAVVNQERSNWIGWSKIGDVSFQLDLTNDAGFRPMDWSGYVYQVLKLDKNAIIYGSGGVTAAFPVKSPAPTFGFKNMINVGIKNKTAVAGDEHIHFCVDVLGCLYKITTEGVTRLGYEEYLRTMTNPVLIWDVSERRLHISDASIGYIYNEETLTGGYKGITGFYRVRDNLTAVLPGTFIADTVEICTDIIDFKGRGLKSIESMQFDAISTVNLEAAIDYRFSKEDMFKTTKWSPLNNEGVAHIRTAGVEFRIRLRGLVHGDFDLSYISIQHKLIDQRFTRDAGSKNPWGGIDVY